MKNVDEMKLRGFVTPGDFVGTDTEKLKKAIATAKEKDICKVVIEGDLTVEETLVIPPRMHLYFDNACIVKKGESPLFVNSATGAKPVISLEDQYFCLNGENSVIDGKIYFYNANEITIEDLTLKKGITFEFCREVRLERVGFEKAGLSLIRGSNNFVMQDLSFTGEKVLMDTSLAIGEYVMGKDAEIHDVIFRRSSFKKVSPAITLDATETEGILSLVIDEMKTEEIGLAVSGKAGKLPPERYFNITATDFDKKDAIRIFSDTKNCTFR